MTSVMQALQICGIARSHAHVQAGGHDDQRHKISGGMEGLRVEERAPQPSKVAWARMRGKGIAGGKKRGGSLRKAKMLKRENDSRADEQRKRKKTDLKTG